MFSTVKSQDGEFRPNAIHRWPLSSEVGQRPNFDPSCCPLFFVPEKLIAYQREFHALKERLRVAEHRTLQRSSELNTILEQFRRAIAETNSSKDALTNFSGKAKT